MYYYFNMNSLINDGSKEEVYHNEQQYILVDNDLRIIGNRPAYYNASCQGQRYIKGKRLNLCNKYPPFPESIGIEISSQCNYHCKMCPRRKLERPSINMEPQIFFKIIDEIKNYDIKMLGLYRLGESLMHPNFFEFLDYAGKFNSLSNTFLSTNAGLLNDEIIERLLASSLKFFKISMNAIDRKTYEAITGRDSFDRVSRIAKSIKARKTKRIPFISFQFLEQDFTMGQVPAFVDEYIDYADFVENSVLEDFGGQLSQNSRFLESNVYANTKRRFSTCRRSELGYALIYSNGDVVPCICDINARYLKVGNIYQSSLKEIFEGEAWAKFREMHRNETFRNHPLCGKCLDRMIFDLTTRKQI